MAMSRAERRRAEKLAKNKHPEKPSGLPNTQLILQDAVRDMQAGELKKALAGFKLVNKHEPNRMDVKMAVATVSFDLKDYKQAASSYASVVKKEPNNAKAQFGLALAQKSLGVFKEAAMAARAAVDLSNGAAEPLRLLIELLWAIGETKDIPELCRKLLVHEPHRTDTAMFEGMAYYHLGEREKARTVFAYDDLVEVHDLEAPEGYADMAAFNKALADHIVDHPTMAVPDKDHPTYHNDQLNITRELVGPNATDDPGPIAVLEAMIAVKVDDYLARKKDKLDHDFINRWPKKSRLTAWGTLLKGRGNLVSHIHIDGYLGMVYYPELPAEMRAEAANSGEDQRGFLQLGDPPEDFPVDVEADAYTIQPKEGRLIMFPGYFFHRTVPFESKDRRISIAFDVVAEK
ncbi:MAG: putative 2OG-Fe(II) oxygenase [Hyphomicrobiales bacterium]